MYAKQVGSFTVVSFLAHFSTPKMVAICSSEKSANFQRTSYRYNPDDRTIHSYRSENFKPFLI
jgi:hypothetical protein